MTPTSASPVRWQKLYPRMIKLISLAILHLFVLTISYSQTIKTNDTIKFISLDTTIKKSETKLQTLNKRNVGSQVISSPVHTSNLSEWDKGFISGLIATIIGFILTMVWDIFKTRRDKGEKDKIIKKLIQDVLRDNLVYIASINNILSQELTILHQKQSVIANITILKNDFWDLIKFNIPKDLLKNNDLLKNLQDISTLIKFINESINSREMYRLNNQAMNNFCTSLEHYDEIIFNENENLKVKITSFLALY